MPKPTLSAVPEVPPAKRGPKPRPKTAPLPADLEATTDRYIMRLVKDAASAEVTFDQKAKVAQVLVAYFKIKKNLPDDDQGKAWEED